MTPAGTPLDATPREQPRAFAHASEAEFARILDFYEVRWEYEPDVFPILWDLEGNVLESFAPDFYLPELDLYVEMTTLRQQLVRKKNRKLRRLRELYPDIRIKLFYARDFRALLLKYGRVALADALSGATGQVVPVRRATAAPPIPPLDEVPVRQEDIEPAERAVEAADAPRGASGARSIATARRMRAARRARRLDPSKRAGVDDTRAAT